MLKPYSKLCEILAEAQEESSELLEKQTSDKFITSGKERKEGYSHMKQAK